MKKLLFSLIPAIVFFFTSVSPIKAEWTNVCGSGTDADWSRRDGCEIHCSSSSMSCSNSSSTVIKFTCDGRQTECRSNASSWSTYQSIGNPGCGKTVQIDVFAQQNFNQLIDYMVWYTGDCPTPTPTPKASPTPKPSPSPKASPTPTPTPTPSPTPSPTPGSCNNTCSSNNPCESGLSCVNGRCRNPQCSNDTDCICDVAEHKSSCDDLSAVGGNNSLVPAKVTLRTKASDNKGNIQSYKYYFGDGKTLETDDLEIQHTYESSGSFTARVDVKDSAGNWKTSNACETKVTVKASPVESHKSDCSDVFITADNSGQAPSNVKFEITGFDNKGDIQAYKIDYGTGENAESNDNDFTKRYETPGTYTIRAYIKDSQGNWQGGDEGCKRTLYINTKPITTQPATGTPTVISLVGISSGLSGVALKLLKKKLV